MRALVVGHSYVVPENQAKLEFLSRLGAEVGVVAPREWRSRDWQRTMEFKPACSAVEGYPCRVIGSGRARVYIFRPHELALALRTFAPDIVQIEQECYSAAAYQLARACRKQRVPFVVLGHENLNHRYRLPPRATRSYVLRHASAAIGTNSEATALLSEWGYIGPRSHIPQFGVPASNLRRARKDPARLRIGFVGRLVPEKGIETLLRAIADLSGPDEGIEAVVCGDGPDRCRLERLTEDLNLSDRVSWTGAVPHSEVEQIMRSRMDALVLPSRTTPRWKEQFGHVLVEAMAAGVPAIGSTSGAIPEVIGIPDLVFPEGDHRALAMILRSMQSGDTYDQLAQLCLERAGRMYSHEAVAARTLAVWRGTTGSP